MTTTIVASIVVSALFVAGISLLGLYLVGSGAGIPEVLFITASLVVLAVAVQYYLGPIILASSTSLKYLGPGANRFLEEIVKGVSTRAQVPQPKIALVDDPAPNAFVFGRTQGSATLAVHTGLLEALREDEIRAVIGHELGHVKHKDFIVITMLSTIPLIAFIIGRLALEGTRIEARSRRKEEDAGLVLMAIGLFSYAIYMVSLMVVRRLSRLRESYADAYSAYVTGSPSSLIGALVKITYGATLDTGSRGLRAFYLVDPPMAIEEMNEIMERKDSYDLNKDGVLSEAELEQAMEKEAESWSNRITTLFSTHPPTYKRILLLKTIEDEMRASGFTEGNIYKHV